MLVVLSALVEYYCLVRERLEAMRASGGNVQLAVVFGTQRDAHPTAEHGRPPTNVHRDVEYLPREHTEQLPLRVGRLIVQAAQDAASGARDVVLHESLGHAGLRIAG